MQKVDDFVDKAIPVAEDAYAKAKPLAEQVQIRRDFGWCIVYSSSNVMLSLSLNNGRGCVKMEFTKIHFHHLILAYINHNAICQSLLDSGL